MSGDATIHVMVSGSSRNPVGSTADLDMIIAVGLGSATVSAGDATLFNGEPGEEYYVDHRGRRRRSRCKVDARSRRVMRGHYLTLRRVEKYIVHRARSGAPLDGPFECSIYGPLWDATWVREAPGRWVCKASGMGFA